MSIKPGGSSSGLVPPAATSLAYRPWEAVGVDSSEWLVPHQKLKLKFIVFIDLATRLLVIHIVKVYGFLEMQGESSADFIQGLAEKWLSDKPKPRTLIPDNATAFKSREVHDFCNQVGIQLTFPAEKESWAHGIVESAIKDIKMTASAIQIDQPSLDPKVTLMLSAAALNSTEYTKGYSSYQWCYGKDYTLEDEDIRTFHDPLQDGNSMSYEALVRARQDAEAIARKTRALRVMSRLKNSTVRQPLRTFHPTQLVKVWRREWPAHLHQGKRGGGRKAVKPHWIGPGRVIFHEVLLHQDHEDERRHIVWVLIGTQLMRCSVHSVRPVTTTEQMAYEIANKDDPTQWRSIADLLPQRDFTDLTDQVSGEHEQEEPDLPDQPDPDQALVPLRRAGFKQRVPPSGMVPAAVRRRLQELEDTGEYEPSIPDEPAPPDPSIEVVNDYGTGSAPSTGPPVPTAPAEEPSSIVPPDEKRRKTDHDDSDLFNASSRQLPNYSDVNWLDNMVVEEDQSWECFETILDDNPDVMTMEFELNFTSNRQQKMFLRNPTAFLVKKMRDSEVIFGKLSAEHRALFIRAKTKEVNSFIQNQAVRKSLDDAETKTALSSGRILRARWVLTWKLIPPEDRAAARQDGMTNPSTVHTKEGDKKAKARIVLLGYEHPELGSTSYRTSSPVQSVIARNLLYQITCQHGWKLEGLDLATAFLQTRPTSADEEMWTSGVAELREALQVGPEGIMKILKNIYGSTTAPRGLWLDLHRTLCSLGGRPAMGERCLWLWASSTEKDAAGHPKIIGMMGGHVDDFHRIGDPSSSEWSSICARIDKAYQWGSAKCNEYRHAGTDVKVTLDNDGDQVITVNQQYYIDMLTDVEIPVERLRDEATPLSKQDLAACRASLGALQWLAVQTQPLLCGRCNILLKAKTWRDVCIITFADQAHVNRPGGDSTGGIITMLAGPEAKSGQVCPMVLLQWRAWKLKRKAIGSNDAEVQAVLEGEDANFRVKLLWSELHGAGWDRPVHADQVSWAEQQARDITGILCTDSRGGYDAVQVNESPLLGLSNLRSALQAMQLRESMMRVGTSLRWLASDYDLADSMTKKRPDCRTGLTKYPSKRLWCIAFDPSFTAAKKNAKSGRTAVRAIDEAARPDLSL